MTLYRVIYEVHGIISADSMVEAEEAAAKLAELCTWILKSVVMDNVDIKPIGSDSRNE